MGLWAWPPCWPCRMWLAADFLSLHQSIFRALPFPSRRLTQRHTRGRPGGGLGAPTMELRRSQRWLLHRETPTAFLGLSLRAESTGVGLCPQVSSLDSWSGCVRGSHPRATFPRLGGTPKGKTWRRAAWRGQEGRERGCAAESLGNMVHTSGLPGQVPAPWGQRGETVLAGTHKDSHGVSPDPDVTLTSGVLEWGVGQTWGALQSRASGPQQTLTQ